ncbi:hypothetical protein PBAL39_20239 [Pedobacter sp. BAL39]|uniref:hypothetical protein n=1 Tax=Pedobacter sp. BAL39 TaxID=391596 RepID=UPI0001559A1B|nr:hypothetical protein [Pedobacter sp. BAL39]EDM36249.1 hypothetical protein PBAL39_20239 [Pedobacter sp. BAL39]
MPSINNFAKHLGTKPGNVGLAYKELREIHGILYTEKKVATFMTNPCPTEKVPTPAFTLPSQIVNRKSSNINFKEPNYLTIGQKEYDWSFDSHLCQNFIDENRKKKNNKESDEALNQVIYEMLHQKGLWFPENSSCISREGKTIKAILRTLTNERDSLIVDCMDEDLISELNLLNLNIEFVTSDECGINLDNLSAYCKHQTVRVVLMRPGSDHSYFEPTCAERWVGLLEMAAQYGFYIIIWDDNYQTRPIPGLSLALRSGIVLYCFPISRVGYLFEAIEVVVGFNPYIHKFAKNVTKKDTRLERVNKMALVDAYNNDLIYSQQLKIAEHRKKATYRLTAIYNNYSEIGTLHFSNSGNFALINLKLKLNPAQVKQMCDEVAFGSLAKVRCCRENEPIERLDLDLFTADLSQVEQVFKFVRDILKT